MDTNVEITAQNQEDQDWREAAISLIVEVKTPYNRIGEEKTLSKPYNEFAH
jgi:hypothetical protein